MPPEPGPAVRRPPPSAAPAHSRYARELDTELEPWRVRPLEGSYPYLMLDARYEKARVEHRIMGVAVGVDEEGYRQVLAVDVAHGETKASWSAFLEGLVERGLEGVELVVSDAHPGLADARRRHLPGVPWQRCQRHFLENALERAPKALEDELHKRLRAIWDEAEGPKEARAGLRALASDLESEHPELAEWLEVEGEGDALMLPLSGEPPASDPDDGRPGAGESGAETPDPGRADPPEH